jgi:hypothetical protein
LGSKITGVRVGRGRQAAARLRPRPLSIGAKRRYDR